LIHLDTSFLVRGLVAESAQDRQLRRWFRDDERLGMSTIAWTEFVCGPVAARELELALRVVSEPEPFVRADAELAASLFNASGRRRGTLNDCMIAAAAIRAGGRLATANPDDFRRFTQVGLRLLTA
jgi:predicted nucleic acid-binding protein